MRLLTRDTKTVPPGQGIYFDFEFNASLERSRQQLRALIGARGPASPDQHLRYQLRSSMATQARALHILSFEAGGSLLRPYSGSFFHAF